MLQRARRFLHPRCDPFCRIFALQALLQPAQWTTGRSKIFLKDAALDTMISTFKRHHARLIVAWWKMARQRRLYLRFKRAVTVTQRLARGRIMRRKFQMVAKQITVLQANVRRRLAVKRFKKILRIRAGAVAKIQATARMAAARKR